MAQSNGPSPKVPRSRGGCAECRRRHRRCDEAKPTCGYCTSAKAACNYTRGLSWGGRPFKKSRFGTCGSRDSRVVKIVLEENSGTGSQFVYGARPAGLPQAASGSSAMAPGDHMNEDPLLPHDVMPITSPSTLLAAPVDEVGEGTSPLLRLSGLSPGPDLTIVPRRFRPLLDYFQHAVSRSLSCHEGIQRDFCSVIIPISLQSQHLLAAVLCASACHRQSVGLPQSRDEITQLRSTAYKSLNIALACSDFQESESTLVTSLVLCISEIISSETKRDTWRLHLAGASALLRKLQTQQTSSLKQPSSSIIFMERLYQSLKAIALGCGMASDGLDENEDGSRFSSHYIDDLAGFTTALLPIFNAINRIDTITSHQPGDLNTDAQMLPVQLLIQQVRTMLAERRHSVFRTTPALPESTQTDFYLLDEAYHHMALLQLYRHADSTLSSYGSLGPATQASVRRIISCIADMNIGSHPCPGVATLPPLFTAGRAASTPQDRERILSLLQTVYSCFGMGNVVATREFLQKRWSGVASSTGNEDRETWEFLPY